MSFKPKALLGFVAAVTVSLAVPALASAAIQPVLALTQTSGTTAGTSPYQMGFDVKLNPSPGDSPKDITTVFPAGLLANADLAGGACLTSSSPNAACQIASGTATVNGSMVPAAEYLERAPQAADVAGVGLVINGSQVATADVTLRTSPDVGLDVAFSNLPAGNGLSELNLTLTNLRLPTACPTPPANVTVQADSQQDSTTRSTSAPLGVSGCGGVPYSPQASATIKRDSTGGAEVVAALTQAASESANKSIELDLPPSLSPNATADLPCFVGNPCTVGNASATSPLVPAPALAGGVITLGGTLVQPTITVSFPAPFAFSLVGNISLSNDSVTFTDVPDLPLTSLNLDITGPNGQKAFRTSCAPSNITVKFTAQGGQTKTSVTPITYTGCSTPGKPTVSGALGGLRRDRPTLALRFKHGTSAPNLTSVSVRAPAGLSFSRSAVHHICVRHGKKRRCTTQVRGLSLRGAALKRIQVSSHVLVITLKRAAGRFSLTARGPLLNESRTLARRVRQHDVKKVTLKLRVTDAKRHATTIGLTLRAR